MEGKRYDSYVKKRTFFIDRMEQFMNLLLNTVKHFEFCRQINFC